MTLRWTEDELRAHLTLNQPAANTIEQAARKLVVAPIRDVQFRRGRMNKTEERYAAHLSASPGVQLWRFEAMKLRLADGSWYTPDFYVLTHDGRQEIHETKGFMREAAAVRLKVAAELFPWFQFRVVRLRKGSWDVYPVPGRVPLR